MMEKVEAGVKHGRNISEVSVLRDSGSAIYNLQHINRPPKEQSILRALSLSMNHFEIMVSNSLTLAAAWLPIAVLAAPSDMFPATALPGKGDILCGPNQLYVVEKDGRHMHWPSPSAFGNNTGCV